MEPTKPNEFELTIPLEDLERGLKQAKAELRDNARGASVTALSAVINFIASIPQLDRQYLTTPLWPLRMALKDLDNGRTAELLKPTPGFHNRRPDSWTRKLIKVFSIYSVDVMRRSGIRVETACRLVAKELDGASFRIGSGRGKSGWKTVKNWRDRISKLPREDESRSILRQFIDQTDWQRATSAEEAKSYALEKLRSLLRDLGRAALE